MLRDEDGGAEGGTAYLRKLSRLLRRSHWWTHLTSGLDGSGQERLWVTHPHYPSRSIAVTAARQGSRWAYRWESGERIADEPETAALVIAGALRRPR